MNEYIPDINKSLPILEVSSELQKRAAKIGVDVDQNQLSLFVQYYQELIFWNRQINLISEHSAGEIIERHFVDSLTPLPLLKKETGFLLDLGSGGGFPGIPLKILAPNLNVFLVDASRKKTSFLSHIVRILKLTEVTVIRGRIEDLAAGKEWMAKFDTVISRAAFKLPQLIIFASSFLKRGGQLIAMKGPTGHGEDKAAKVAAQSAGMTFSGEAAAESEKNHSLKKLIVYRRL